MGSMEELNGWYEEKQSAYLYKILSDSEKHIGRKQLFSRLGGEAEKQAQIWAEKAKKQNVSIPEFTPGFRANLVSFLIRTVGGKKIKGILAAMKVRGLSVYSNFHPAGHETPQTLSDVGRHHHGMDASNNLRAGVFGINDGLISNASLILGVSAATVDQSFIILSGGAGLLAGACSMAAGEYVSVRSQRELFEYQMELERDELLTYPEEEAQELSLIYQAKGITKEEADSLSKKIIADPERALDTLAREELGLNPDELGSPWGAALSSFVSFAVGALVPLLPFLFLPLDRGFKVSMVLTGLTLFSVGALLSLFTGRSALWSGLRMLVIGACAGTIAYQIGHLIGV